MKAIQRAIERLRGMLSGRTHDQEMTDEIESHIQMQTEDNLRAGMPPEMARRNAVLKFGGIESVKETYREQRGLPLIETFLIDVRYALRGLKKSPSFTVTAIAALALGIGATTAIFSVVNTVLLRPLPIFEPDRFVILGTNSGESSGIEGEPTSSPAEFAHWRRQSSVLQDVSALMPGAMNYAGNDVLEQWQSIRASADTFRAWGIRILRGRTFTAEEDSPNGPRVAVISEGVWKRRFGSSPDVLGKPVALNGEPYTLIGIVEDSPAMRSFGNGQDVYVPFQLDPNTRDLGRYFYVVGRLKPGASLEQARAQLWASTGEFRAQFPSGLGLAGGSRARFDLDTVRGSYVSDARLLLNVLFGAVSLVLLIACANVANLLLGRASGRRREIAIRMAIGAGRRRVIRQLMTESLLLSLAGGGLGLLLGYRGIRALLSVNTADLPFVGEKGAEVVMDWRVVAFALGVSLLTAILFGLLPAFQSSRENLDVVLKSSGARSAGGLRQNKTRAVLVMSEISLAVVLLIGSALLIRTFYSLYSFDRGFDSTNVLTMESMMSGPKYQSPAGLAAGVRQATDQIRSIPGVVSASATGCMYLNCTLGLEFGIIGQPAAEKSANTHAGWVPVSPGFFDVFKVALKRGRTFTDRDDNKSTPVVVISETMAKQFWKDRDPLGEQIEIGAGSDAAEWKDSPRQIIGIVADVRNKALIDTKAHPIMYLPESQLPQAEYSWLNRIAPLTWIVRTQTDPLRSVPAIREQLGRATGVPLGDIHSMTEVLSISIAQQRMSMLLMTVFGCCALLLASIGIYGLMAYTVSQRTQEIGIRMALGAEATQVRNMVVRQGIGLAAAGVLAGLALAWALARMLQDLLFGVKAHDPLVFVSVPFILGAIALLAVWIPGTRASRINPMDSLRCE